jgi:DNA mismatch repair ATPase MutL
MKLDAKFFSNIPVVLKSIRKTVENIFDRTEAPAERRMPIKRPSTTRQTTMSTRRTTTSTRRTTTTTRRAKTTNTTSGRPQKTSTSTRRWSSTQRFESTSSGKISAITNYWKNPLSEACSLFYEKDESICPDFKECIIDNIPNMLVLETDISKASKKLGLNSRKVKQSVSCKPGFIPAKREMEVEGKR